MKIIDAFIFNDELDMLDFRLSYLYPYVDNFLLIESPVTFAGTEKPLYYDRNKDRYKHFGDKLIYYRVDDLLDLKDSWAREHRTRNAMAYARYFASNDDDLVMMSDIDEIPDVRLLNIGMHDFLPCVLMQTFFYYSVNWVKPHLCDCTIITKAGALKETTPQELRDIRNRLVPIQGGWHFSYFGGRDMIKNKIRTFAHQEYNCEPYITDQHIDMCMSTGRDLFNRRQEDLIPFDRPRSLPPFLLDNRNTYAFFWGDI